MNARRAVAGCLLLALGGVLAAASVAEWALHCLPAECGFGAAEVACCATAFWVCRPKAGRHHEKEKR